MKRDLKELKLPVSGLKVQIKEWITAREDIEVRKELLNSMKMKTRGNKVDVEATTGDAVFSREKKYIEVVVESLDGNKKNIYDRLLDLRKEDYKFVKEKAEKIMDFKKPE